MSHTSRLDRVYAQLLRDHPYGWALYKKVTTRDVHPGSCGYFDAEGDWQTIADLGNTDELGNNGWTIPDDVLRSRKPESMVWGPKNSGSVQSRSVGGKIGSTVVVAPVDASVAMSFESSTELGAVLATESPVWKNQIGNESSAVQWMADNTADMLRRYGATIKKHGIWIVTKTYSTRRCAVAVMTDKSSTVEIGLDANVQGVLTLAPKSKWTSSSGNSSMELHEDEDGVVVFISGMYFTKKLFGSKLSHVRDQVQQKDKILRGDEDDEDYEAMQLAIEYYPDCEEENDDSEDELSE